MLSSLEDLNIKPKTILPLKGGTNITYEKFKFCQLNNKKTALSEGGFYSHPET